MVNLTLLKSTRVPRGALSPQDYTDLASYVFSCEKVRGPVELAVDITGHKRIQELNRRFRGVDRTTDVISFRNDTAFTTPYRRKPVPILIDPGGRRGDINGVLMGDIGINVQQASIQAKKMRHSLKREMRLLLIHGILHLLGYTDYEPCPRRKMFKRQNAILRNWERRRPL